VYAYPLSLKTSHNTLLDGFKGWGRMVLRDGWKCEAAPNLGNPSDSIHLQTSFLQLQMSKGISSLSRLIKAPISFQQCYLTSEFSFSMCTLSDMPPGGRLPAACSLLGSTFVSSSTGLSTWYESISLDISSLIYLYQGVFICCIGMGLLVFSDQTQNSDGGPGQSMLSGDLFMLAGATLYGFSVSPQGW